MLDYHLHLWPHAEATTWLSIDQVAEYCETAAASGVTQIALTEHLHRFTQATDVVGRFWERTEDSPAVRAEIAAYFDHHARSDLDAYVALCESAKAAGLPVVTGLEVDYYAGQMDEVAALLDGYPFDVLLGSVHWIGAWQFDSIESAVHMADGYARGASRSSPRRARATCSPIPTSSSSPVTSRARPRSGGTVSLRPRPPRT